MLLSYNWLKEFIDIDLTYSELDNILTMLGIELEGSEFQAQKFENFIIAEVIEKDKHPDADKLSVCQVNTGDNVLQVICGAPNVDKGQKVILGKSGAIVPNGGFKLEKRKIRGIESNGMICSLAELELGEDTGGIYVLPSETVVGMPISEYFAKNDIILELGLTPNKSDCLSHLGIARELAAHLGKQINYPNQELEENNEDINNYLKISILDNEKCPRYSARMVKNCKLTESPSWLKNRLESLELRPKNIAVDVTNLVLMECGQPLHAFDYNQIIGKQIIVKTATEGDKFISLDGKERTLNEGMLVICDSERPIAIAGVMGGQNSEISNDTIDIVIESAFFNPSSVRKTSKKLALQSDSSYRFERGVDISNITNALDRAAKLIAELSGGEVVGGIIDIYPNPLPQKELTLRYERVNKVLGTNLSKDIIDNILISLLFEKKEDDIDYSIFAIPYHRVDCDSEIDLIEEVARLYNYDNIDEQFSSEINFATSNVVPHLQMPKLRNNIRTWFVSNGFNELLTQNQIDPRSAELFSDNPIRIANPLGEELSIMRPSMISSFLNVVSKNIRNNNYNLKLFEVGKIFRNDEHAELFIKGIKEEEYLTIALTGSAYSKQWSEAKRDVDYFDLKGIITNLFDSLSISNYKFANNDTANKIFSNESQSILLNNKHIGILGAINKQGLKHFDIEHKVYIASFSLEAIYNVRQKAKKYSQISPFPRVYRDLAFIVDKKVSVEEINKIIQKYAGKLCTNITLFDVYEGKNLGDNQRSLAFNIEFTSFEKTMTDSETETYIQNIVTNVSKLTGGILRN
ncbi:MAG TPA: phenylalanine--tRNA ligase subunit beta [Candidatus Kapabacteria bacterium]|nr:phenylalanine--tRNA ligase subunit beta [Candidatus Kapabacteria bacterium]